MLNRLSTILLSVALVSYGCKTLTSPFSKPPTVGAITEEGLLNCFTPGTSVNGQPVWCEASAVLFDGNKILVANDKDMPAGQSSVFSKAPNTLSDSTKPPTYLTQPAFTEAHKYEDFARTPDGKFVFLTTAFDRVKPNSHDWDGYNTILYWRTGDPEHPRVLAPDDNSTTSIAYRQRIAQVLATNEFPGAIPYFKVEGLAATDRQLLFGIREEGKSYSEFKHRIKVVAVSYNVDKTNRIRLADDWKLIADFNPANVESTLPQPLALSSLEYDPKRKRFWLLTSLEANGKLDAYLWSIKPSDLYANKPFTFIRNVQGQPLRLGHKAEDLTILDNNRLLLIHDDDRAKTKVGLRERQPHQAAYTIITIR
ncbi:MULTISPECIES: hypothetical protein [Spirosoma]|uniref:Esterase-like activity of phytase family protein n=1 Tax=Spirosoma liriopis TaxID=2937440 RepID=A0ABT0HLG8_9BACT|nr:MULTISPECIES: hypothetical protein [Spirosoma]MCK8492805.1 hypothetical protein [Spirosoma liriopis]UHG92268.1 hypothetical protein LQ777_05020 [Spirosoma oryzicola]